MLIHRLKVAGLLSFGPAGIDLSREPLKVLIGPNGSGKSNFLEAVALLQSAPRSITEPISRLGGIREWLWKGPDAPQSITMETAVDYPHGGVLRHSLTITTRNGRLEVTNEQVEPSENHPEKPACPTTALLRMSWLLWRSQKPTQRQNKPMPGVNDAPVSGRPHYRSKTPPRGRRLRK